MSWIPSGFRAESERIPNAYIRYSTLRNSTLLNSNAFELACKSNRHLRNTRARDVLELRASHAN